MKNFLRLMVFTLFGIQSIAMNAQGVINLFSGSIGGPSLKVIVLNNTTGGVPILVTIGQYASRGLVSQGSTFDHTYGMFSNPGSIVIYVQTCDAATPAFRFNPAPDWTKDTTRFGDAALTDDFLRSRPSERDIEYRVKWVKNIIHGDPGRKRLEQELNEWAYVVKNEGVSFAVVHCDNPRTIPLATVNYLQWYSYAQNMNAVVDVIGNPKDGYHIVNPPQFITAI